MGSNDKDGRPRGRDENTQTRNSQLMAITKEVAPGGIVSISRQSRLYRKSPTVERTICFPVQMSIKLWGC